MFEGLIDAWPKRFDVWDMYVSLEQGARGSVENGRRLFERMAGLKMKKRRAMFVFKKWLEFEGMVGDEGSQERVKERAAEYAQKLKDGDGGDDE